MNDSMGIINLDEDQNRMGKLVHNGTLGSIPIAARYRIIDFVISNMVNSGIDDIGIFTNNKSKEIVEHLGNGKPWDLNRKRDGLRIFNFGYKDLSVDDVHNFAENIEFIKNARKKYVIMAPSYMVCNIHYDDVIRFHIDSKNDITVIYKNIDNADNTFINCDTFSINENRKLLSVGRNLGKDSRANISMEMYVLSTELFIDIVMECLRSGKYKKIKQYISSNLDKFNVGTYRFYGYVSCVNSMENYYDINMDLLKDKVSKELFFQSNPIYTRSNDEAPTNYSTKSIVKNSIIANGCYIEGEVRNSIIGRRVHIGRGAKIENCIIFEDSIVGQNSIVNGAIIDRNSEIKSGEQHIYSGKPVFI